MYELKNVGGRGKSDEEQEELLAAIVSNVKNNIN